MQSGIAERQSGRWARRAHPLLKQGQAVKYIGLERIFRNMATRLDQEIEQLEKLVERYLDYCAVTSNGMRCVLPRNHQATVPHKFPPALPGTNGLQVGAPKGFCASDESTEPCRFCVLFFDAQEGTGSSRFDS